MEENNEVTLKLIGDLEELNQYLKDNNFKVTGHFTLYDTYMIPNDLNLEEESIRDIISKAIIIRKVEDFYKNEIRRDVVYKIKDFDENGDIVSQKSIRMKIKDSKEGIIFFSNIGYKTIMYIVEEDYEYSNGEITFATKDIKDGLKLIEVETRFNSKYNTIDKIINYLKDEKMPLDFSDCFIKKAEIELSKVLNRN